MNNKQGRNGDPVCLHPLVNKAEQLLLHRRKLWDCFRCVFIFQKLVIFMSNQFSGSSEWLIAERVIWSKTTGPFQLLGNVVGLSVINLNWLKAGDVFSFNQSSEAIMQLDSAFRQVMVDSNVVDNGHRRRRMPFGIRHGFKTISIIYEWFFTTYVNFSRMCSLTCIIMKLISIAYKKDEKYYEIVNY